MYDVIDDMICMIYADAMVTLDNKFTDELYFLPFLEGITNDSTKLFGQSFKANHILCFHEDIICFNYKNIFICFISPGEEISVRRASDNIYCDEDRFK